MSRATLARQFQKKLGRSASDLLTDICMALAANELKNPSMSTGAVAEAVGYQSEAAFQRAFKSHILGMTPAEWRKTQRRSRSGRSGLEMNWRPNATRSASPAATMEAAVSAVKPPAAIRVRLNFGRCWAAIGA
jgi:Helix-turn-helix domain